MRIVMLAVVASIGAGALVSAENWPCFRGPGHQGISRETGLPLKWSATNGIAWKSTVPGDAWSSPIVWGDRIYLTSAAEGGASCRVLALELGTGRGVWDRELFRQQPGHKQERNSYATPTPCTDGEHVYAVFGDGSIGALDLGGRVAWQNREFPFYGEHGLGASPVLWEDLLIMTRDGSNENEPKKLGWQVPWDKSFVFALDKNTGRVRWKTTRGLSRIGHVSPTLWGAPDGGMQLVSGAGDVLQGYDAKTGDRVWSCKNIGEGVVPSLVVGDGLVFTASGWGGRESLKAFRLGGRGELGESSLVWEQRKGMPRIPSFVFVSPYLFTVSEGGIAMCLKAETGEIVWQERVEGTYSASPVVATGRIYLLSDSGETTVIEAGPEFRVLARNPLGEKAQASIAVSQGRLLIRTASQLWCVGSQEAGR